MTLQGKVQDRKSGREKTHHGPNSMANFCRAPNVSTTELFRAAISRVLGIIIIADLQYRYYKKKNHYLCIK